MTLQVLMALAMIAAVMAFAEVRVAARVGFLLGYAVQSVVVVVTGLPRRVLGRLRFTLWLARLRMGGLLHTGAIRAERWALRCALPPTSPLCLWLLRWHLRYYDRLLAAYAATGADPLESVSPC